jgi:large subunit ribosomal protein L25
MILNLTAEMRKTVRKSDNGNLRRSGLIPAVMYAEGKAGLNINVPANEFKKLYKKSIGEIAVFNITVDGKEYHTVVKERQINPLSREIIHVDFYELHPDKEVNINVPLKFVGTPAAVKDGGILEIVKRSVSAHCLPKFIPEDFEISLVNMKMGETIYCKDVKIENVKIAEHADTAIVSVHTPRNKEVKAETAE